MISTDMLRTVSNSSQNYAQTGCLLPVLLLIRQFKDWCFEEQAALSSAGLVMWQCVF